MGGKAKKTIFHEVIKSPEHMEEVIARTEGGPIAIVDCHLAWCGPCEPMVPNYASLWFSYDEPETRLSFWHLPEEHIPEEQLKARVVLIFKNKRSSNNIDNYRPISLTNSIHKIFTAILRKRLAEHIDPALQKNSIRL